MDRLFIWMDNSIFFCFIKRILDWMRAFCSGSVLVRAAVQPIRAENLRKSATYRVLYWPFKKIAGLRDRFFIQAIENSLTYRAVYSLPSFLLNLNAAEIICGFIAGTSAYLLFSLLGGFSVNYPTMIILAMSCVAILIFLLISFPKIRKSNSRLYDWIQSSIIYRVVSKYFSIGLPLIVVKKKRNEGLVFSILVGVLSASALYYLPLIYALAILAGVPGAIIVASYPFIGLVGIVFLAPFVPTMLLAAFTGGVWICFLLKLLYDKKYSFHLDLIGITIICFIVLTIVKGFASFSMISSLKIAALTSLFMTAYFLFVSLVDNSKKLSVILFSFSTSAALTGLYGLMQRMSGMIDMTWVDTSIFRELGFRVYSTFGNPNVYGEYLLLAISISIIAFFCEKKTLLKLYYMGIFALLVLNLGLTMSRGCFLAFGLGALIFILFMEKRFVILFSAGIFAAPMVLSDTVIKRIASITNLADSSTAYRISIWQATLRMIKDFWMTGVGQGIDAYNTVYPLYGFSQVAAPHAHNVFLQILAETGIFGLISFFAILFCFFKTIAPIYCAAKKNVYKIFAAVLMSGLAAFMFQGIFDYVFYNYKVFFLFFIYLGFAGALNRIFGLKDSCLQRGDSYD